MANFNLNKVILGGRLTDDPRLSTTASGISVCSFSVAVNRRYASKSNEDQPQADFIRCTAWRATAEFISRYFRKASSICVIGTLQNRNWTDQQGVKHYTNEVTVDEAMFVDAKNERPANAQDGSSYVPEGYGSAQGDGPAFGGEAPKFEEITDEEDLPF